jgi:hypothetical protein
MSQPSENRGQHSFYKRTAAFLKHPLGAAILTFLFTGVAATLFSSWLSSISKTRDIEVAATQRAAESVKAITDLIFERSFRANMIVSSIRRNAEIEEIKERKKAYDITYVRYNSTIQSNLFRVREMFHTIKYTDFEQLFEGPLRALLVAQDNCVTNAYDNAISSDASKRTLAVDNLSHCPKIDNTPDITSIWHSIEHCEYFYTEALFRIVEQDDQSQSPSKLKDEVQSACQFSGITDKIN